MSKQADIAWNTNRSQAMLWLRNTFPLLFSSDVKPLKIGTRQDITSANLDGMPEEKWVSVAIGYFVRSSAYLRCMKAGADRFDLKGLPSGNVTLDAAALARETLILRNKQWSEAARQVKLTQKSTRGKMATDAIQTTPVINDESELIAGTKRRLTLKKKTSAEVVG